jgi:hypothetical protein
MGQNILQCFGKYGLTEVYIADQRKGGFLSFLTAEYFISFIHATDLNISMAFHFYLLIPGVLRLSRKRRYHLKFLSARRVVRPRKTKRKSTKFSRPGDLAPMICAPLMHPI